jgi:hypothetical protein
MIYVFAVIFTLALGTWMWWRSTPDMWWYVGAVAVVMGVGLYGAYRCDRRDAAERDEKTTSARSSDDDRP